MTSFSSSLTPFVFPNIYRLPSREQEHQPANKGTSQPHVLFRTKHLGVFDAQQHCLSFQSSAITHISSPTMNPVASFIRRKSDSISSIMSLKDEAYLPSSTKPKSKFRVRALLGHCLYRRVVVWGLVVVVLFSITLFNPQITHRSRKVLDLVQLGKAGKLDSTHFQTQGGVDSGLRDGDGERERPTATEPEADTGLHWLNYKQ